MSMQDQEGIVKGNNFERYTARANTEFDILPGNCELVRISRQPTDVLPSCKVVVAVAGSSDDENLILTASRMSPIILSGTNSVDMQVLLPLVLTTLGTLLLR